MLAFSETAIAELTHLTYGDAIAVQGALKAETYEKDGATKLSLSVVVDHVLALRQPRKPRGSYQVEHAQVSRRPAFDDALPF